MIDVNAHAEALIEALAAATLTVYDSKPGQKVDGTTEQAQLPYVVVYLDGGVRSAESLGDSQEERAELDAELYSVGTDPWSARWARSRVLALAGTVLEVPGRLVRVRSVFSDPVKPDEDNPEETVYQARDGLTLVSLQQ